MTPRILITDHPFNDLSPEEAVFGPIGAELRVAEDSSEDRLVVAAADCQGVLACYAPVTAKVIESAAKAGCKIVSRYGIGYDNVDIGAATATGIVVTTVPDYCLDEVADHTIALLLSHARAIVLSDGDVHRGRWALPARPVSRLAGQTLALIGFGAIGHRVAARAHAFGLEVVVYDPYAADLGGVRRASTPAEAVSMADFVSLHTPLNEGTRNLIDGEVLAATTKSPLLINTARGGLVDLDAVAQALADGTLSGAALDVTDPEPLDAGHPLLADPRVIVTPHTAFYSAESQIELQTRAAGEVARVLAGRVPQNPRNPEVLKQTDFFKDSEA